MDETTVGTNRPQTPEETQALERRRAIQAYFNAYSSDPSQIFDAMEQFGVGVAELADCMDYRINIIDWMRYNNAPDGFGGLRVWPEADIVTYINWQGQQPNALRNGETVAQGWAARGITDPTTNKHLRVAAQREFDRVVRRQAANPAYVPPWK